MNKIILSFLVLAVTLSCKEENKKEVIEEEVMVEEQTNYEPELSINPISHATFSMEWDGTVFYVDPVGGAQAFEGMKNPNIQLVTDIHGDHMNAETLKATQGNATLITPQAVADKLGEDFEPIILNNGEVKTIQGFTITSIPMYNLTEERLKFHEKGRGNGYVIEKNGYRVYISGDTEDIPEMRNLENINKAIVCMNLPYTMDIEQAANAVLQFQPQEVIPYHYRGTDGYQDVEKFKKSIEEVNSDIKVSLMEWYPNRDNG
ncbi:MBL fold metallo-hydrolase [Nonlabens tegetincola]|uniref:MBL fold metallo-hydrolase n=1 Tax=Nonlabens tegetincola TaxID=323273 RepID=UPI000CF3752C|nr:MBL fold metallo-hydrolase [Nonlabens tegetincola]PQJ18310.1 MBL fold metallo-hydrolase [Nonlabens tegetincola]